MDLCEQQFAARFSSATVEAILDRSADALTAPREDLLEQLRAGAQVNMDETGWRTAGQRRALWGMFSDRYAYLRVVPGRHEQASAVR